MGKLIKMIFFFTVEIGNLTAEPANYVKEQTEKNTSLYRGKITNGTETWRYCLN